MRFKYSSELFKKRDPEKNFASKEKLKRLVEFLF